MLSWKLRKPITGITRTSNLFRVDLALNLNHTNKDSVSFEDAFTKTLRVIESRYMQCGETTNFSTRQELLKNIDINIINWQEHFDRSADHKYAIYRDSLTITNTPAMLSEYLKILWISFKTFAHCTVAREKIDKWNRTWVLKACEIRETESQMIWR